MENVVLTIHLILALLLIGVVLLQRSEGGGLGMGSTGGVMSRPGGSDRAGQADLGLRHRLHHHLDHADADRGQKRL